MADQLGSAVLTLSVDNRQLQAGLSAAESQAKRKGDQIQRALEARRTRVDANQATITRLQKEALTADASRAALIRQQIGLIQIENRELQAGAAILRQKQQQNEGFTRQLQQQIALSRQQGESLKGGVGNFVTGLTGFGGLSAIGAGLGIAAFLRSSIQSAVELESITKRLTNTLGPNGAAGALSFTRGLADQLGLSFTTLSTTFGSFTAAASAANVSLETQKSLFAAVSRAAQQLGLSNDEISGSLLALQQVASKGTVQMEELRGQLGERLPIAFAATALGLGKTQIELIKLVESGKLTAAEFFPALTKGLNELTKGSAGAPTAAQNFQLLGNAWKDLQTEFGTNLLPSVTDGVKGLINLLNGVGVVSDANKLGLGADSILLPSFIKNSLGLIPEEGAKAVGALRALQSQFSLTEKQARSLFTDAVAAEGARYDPLGRLVISADGLNRALNSLVDRALAFKKRNKDVNAELLAQKAILGELSNLATKKVEKLSQEVTAIRSANKLYGDSQQDYQKAVDAYTRLQNKGASGKDLVDAAALVDKVGQNVQTALTQGAISVRDILTQAADEFTNANLAFASVRTGPQGLGRYLAPEANQARLRESVDQLRPLFDQALKQAKQFNPDRTTGSIKANGQVITINEPTLQIEGLQNIFARNQNGGQLYQSDVSAISDFVKAVQAEKAAISNVNAAQKDIAEINQELAGVNAGLRDQVQLLAQKQWVVNVNFDALGQGTAYGDIVNGAIAP